MINIKQEHINILYEIFNNYCPEAEIWAYGSRVDGDSHSGSDFDLTIKNFNSNDKNLFELKEYIEESNLPFLIDITNFENLPQSFQNEITKKHIKFFPQLNIK